MYIVNSPVLFLIFNRPDKTLRVFNEIKKVKPSKIYISADGPRYNNESDLIKCEQSLQILDLIDWNCEVKTLINERNLGCKIAVSNAITWFFDNEEQGIILEDDCLPCESFFKFCDELLLKYQFDNRVGHISGTNFQNGIKRGQKDYYFSRHPIVWGWASWRRVWKNYDINMNNLDLFINDDIASILTNNSRIKKNIINNFIKTRNNEINTWDYQYFYSFLINGYLSIIPNYNLISNIGFGEDATHTITENKFLSYKKLEVLPDNLTHPIIFQSNFFADNYTFEIENPHLLHRLYNKILKLINLSFQK